MLSIIPNLTNALYDALYALLDKFYRSIVWLLTVGSGMADLADLNARDVT